MKHILDGLEQRRGAAGGGGGHTRSHAQQGRGQRTARARPDQLYMLTAGDIARWRLGSSKL
jgi:hypothetical protein